MAPNVAIYTAGHPIHPDTRNTMYEYGFEVIIGDNVWIGGNTVICLGVHIGDNVVIGAGSVVTKDIPEWSIAAGNPCKVIRKITEADRKYYFKNIFMPFIFLVVGLPIRKKHEEATGGVMNYNPTMSKFVYKGFSILKLRRASLFESKPSIIMRLPRVIFIIG